MPTSSMLQNARANSSATEQPSGLQSADWKDNNHLKSNLFLPPLRLKKNPQHLQFLSKKGEQSWEEDWIIESGAAALFSPLQTQQKSTG